MNNNKKNMCNVIITCIYILLFIIGSFLAVINVYFYSELSDMKAEVESMDRESIIFQNDITNLKEKTEELDKKIKK